jgi:hypothetical protein
MKKRYAKVDGYPNLLRDLDTNAIINTDSISASNYDNALTARKNQIKEIDYLKCELDNLKNSIEEIKNLLKGINNGPR